MPIGYFIVPMVPGPYSRENPQRPAYLDEIQANWTGHNVDDLGVYVIKVNSTAEKLADLDSRLGVRSLPRDYTWETVIGDLPIVARTFVQNWLTNHDLPYDATETIGELLQRIINSGLFTLRNVALTATVGSLTTDQRDRIALLCGRWGIEYSDGDTVRQLTDRCGPVFWPGDQLTVEEY